MARLSAPVRETAVRFDEIGLRCDLGGELEQCLATRHVHVEVIAAWRVAGYARARRDIGHISEFAHRDLDALAQAGRHHLRPAQGARHGDRADFGQLGDIGYTIPGQAFTYWNKGPGPGDNYLETEDGHGWAAETARAAAQNLAGVAEALAARPLGAPPE